MAEANNIESSGKGLSLRIKPSRGTKVYIVEYIVMHVALLGVIFAGISLFNELLDQTKEAAVQFDFYDLAGVDYTLLVISYGIVSTILFLWLNARISASENAQPDLAKARRRRLVPYIFLTITALMMVGYLISAVYSILVELFGETPVGSESLWRVLLKQAFALGLIGIVSLMVARGVDPSGSDNVQ